MEVFSIGAWEIWKQGNERIFRATPYLPVLEGQLNLHSEATTVQTESGK
jgi:hypothetical protein